MPTKLAPYDAIHRALLSGVPRQFGLWDAGQRAYRSAAGGFFSVFPGSGLFSGKRHEWVMGMELVETAKLWARRLAGIDPAWLEKVAPHLCRSRYGEAYWDVSQGAVYGRETVLCGGLPVVANRPVHYGRVDPVAARAVFIRDALLAGSLKARCPFMDHLDAMREEVETAEHKLRRPGGLWSDELLLQLFSAVLPVGMCTEKEFHDWRKTNESRLMPPLEELIAADFDALGLERFPDMLSHDGQDYPVYYRAAPGERDDGVTLGVHIDQLWHMPDWLPAWGVPGNLSERAGFFLRSLPKDMRRLCQPVAAVADGFAERRAVTPPDAPIERRLAEYITELTGFPVRPDDFDASKLPDALVTKIWICDDDGAELAMGRGLAELRHKLAPLQRVRHEASANERWRRTGLKIWDGEPLPVRIDITPGAAVFPALTDEGGTLGIRAYSCPAAAHESHRAGCVRMVMLAHADHAIWLKKNIRLGMAAKFELPRLCGGGVSLEDMVTVAAEGALGEPLPRSPGDASGRVTAARVRWHESAQAVARALESSIDCLPDIRAWVDAKSSDRHLAPVAADLAEELQWLLRGRFLWRAGFSRAKGYDRYFRAIRTRIGRLESLPLVKDLEKLARVRCFWQPWLLAWTAAPDDPRWWDFGWQLEEFRVSLFAPDMPVAGKCSGKRLEDAWHKLLAGR